MKTCILGMSDIYGGAAIASYRDHQGLLRAGCNSPMIVGYRRTQDHRIERLRGAATVGCARRSPTCCLTTCCGGRKQDLPCRSTIGCSARFSSRARRP